MKKLTLAVDFDLTLGDTLTPWFEWAIPRADDPIEARQFFSTDGWSGCDWVPLMKASGVREPFEYWLQPDLCDNLEPMDYATTVLRGLHKLARERGYDLHIICVSKCVPEHIATKKRFLERECQGIFSAFIDASEKQYVNSNLIIDDSFEVAQKCAEAGIPVVVPTTSTATVDRIYDGAFHPNIYQWGEKYGDFWETVHNTIGVESLLDIMIS